jgi:hypothetical protein
MLASFQSLPTALLILLSLTDSLYAQEDRAGGYMAAIFKGDVPHVFFNLAPASTPSTFTSLNNGDAVLVPTSGTGGARDPFIFKAEDSSRVSNALRPSRAITLTPLVPAYRLSN